MQKGAELDSAVNYLEKLGLKATIGKIYVAMLIRGESSAKELSDVTGIHRVEVYRRLQELMSLGLCNIKILRPKRYEATPAKLALELLIQKKSNALTQLMATRSKFVALLGDLQSTSANLPKEKQHLEYEIVVGRKQGYAATRKLMREANQEISRIISPNALKRIFKYGEIKEYVACKNRGVTIRIVTDVGKLPGRIVSYCSKNFELRHSPESSMRLLIVDRKMVILSGIIDEADMTLDPSSERYLIIKDESLADVITVLFRHLWSSASEVRV